MKKLKITLKKIDKLSVFVKYSNGKIRKAGKLYRGDNCFCFQYCEEFLNSAQKRTVSDDLPLKSEVFMMAGKLFHSFSTVLPERSNHFLEEVFEENKIDQATFDDLDLLGNFAQHSPISDLVFEVL